MRRLHLLFLIGLFMGDPAAWTAASAADHPTAARSGVAGGPNGLQALTDEDFYDEGTPDRAVVELGRMLFFDKVLSGNMNISCATCHHPFAALGDGLSLSVGEGGRGLGVTRNTGFGVDAVPGRVPRNAPDLTNLGAQQFTRMFHDGRVEVDPWEPSGFRSPAGEQLPPGLHNVLAVQALFPLTSGTEMAGQPGENAIADAAAANRLSGAGGVWDRIVKRLRVIPGYVGLFMAAYPGEVLTSDDIEIVHAANAIAAFEASAWRFDQSPFDRYLRGDREVLSTEARLGMFLFYREAGCSSCHSGVLQTDHEFHAIAMPQIGPGKGDNLPGYDDGLDDFGRERVTGYAEDRLRFRTPSLRNIELTAPYGHAGAFNSLEAVVLHHLDPVGSLNSYDPAHATLVSRADLDAQDFTVMSDPERREAIAAHNELQVSMLDVKELNQLLAFLRALTDPRVHQLRNDVPRSVPSGLPVYD